MQDWRFLLVFRNSDGRQNAFHERSAWLGRNGRAVSTPPPVGRVAPRPPEQGFFLFFPAAKGLAALPAFKKNGRVMRSLAETVVETSLPAIGVHHLVFGNSDGRQNAFHERSAWLRATRPLPVRLQALSSSRGKPKTANTTNKCGALFPTRHTIQTTSEQSLRPLPTAH